MIHFCRKKIVLTGGPCGGKTTLTKLLAKAFEKDLEVVPEAASLVFSGGFPRWEDRESLKCIQRAIYHVQCELEVVFENRFSGLDLILDRGTIDGAAYWPDGAEAYFSALGTSLESELSRYDRVIYLESADSRAYEENKKRNPNRHETWDEAKRLDEQTLKLWSKHPQLTFVQNQCSFAEKVAAVSKQIESEIVL